MGNTALHFTKEYNYLDIADYLTHKGADQEIKNLRGVSASEGIRKNNIKTK